MARKNRLVFLTAVIAFIAIGATTAIAGPLTCNTSSGGAYRFEAQEPYPYRFTGTLDKFPELGTIECQFAECWIYYSKVTSTPRKAISNLTNISFRIPEAGIGQERVEIVDSVSSLNLVNPCQGSPKKFLEGVCDGDLYVLNAQVQGENFFRFWLVTTRPTEGTIALAAEDGNGYYVCPDGYEGPVPGLASYTFTSYFETKFIEGIEIEITRDPLTRCATAIRFRDLGGTWFDAPEVTVQAGPEGEAPERVIRCSSTDGLQACEECQYTAVGSPGWTYITSGSTTRRVCIGYYVPGYGCCDSAGCSQ